ncbi:MAG TPA: lipid A export permease/ATP-binding protein MsbA, partial [Albitalea sp.]|nr:lipid A export permease/ATP-binding protein MsbA [Albitalea sp.]
HRWGLALSVAAFLLAGATEPLVPALLQTVLDKGFVAHPSFPIWMVPVALIGLFALRGSLAFCGAYLLNRSASRTVLAIRTALVRALIRADASLYNHMNPGTAVAKVVNQPQDLTNMLSGALTTVLSDGTTSLALLGYLFYLNWQMTLLALVALPLSALLVRLIHRRVMALGARAYDSQMRLVSVVDDIARAWRVVRTFDAGEWERDRFEAEARHLQRMTIKSSAASSLMSPVSQTVASLGLALILTLGLLQAQRDGTTVGSFVGYITGMLLLVSRVRRLTDVSQPMINGLIVARGCFELLDTPEEPDAGTRTLETCRGDIRFENVTVRYPGAEQPALADLSFEATAGETVALVGASGAGKTTVVSALLGFVKPERGRILLDGVDLEELRKTSLRRQFAVVSQDVVLFDGTLADNVAYAQPRDDARVQACLVAANLWGFVHSQPEGMAMRIGANGSRLSGGQRQRVAIARAIYKNAPILILDEATSALDSESERLVQGALERLMRGRTSIVIAHRLSTIERADRVVAVDSGRVVEAGTHAELLLRGGLYARLHALQFGS